MSLVDFNPAQYDVLLEQKSARLTQLLQPFYTQDLRVFASAKDSFRLRAELRFWHEGDDGFYAMFEQGNKGAVIRMDDLPIASHTIRKAMPLLREAILRQPVLKERLFQVEFLSGLSGDLLISLIYHKALSDEWQNAAKALEPLLKAHIIGRSKKQKQVLSQDYIEETLHIGQRDYHYRQAENSFTQPNGRVNEHMIGWAQSCIEGQNTQDFLELYCGHGNFTVPLSALFRRVLATEISKTSVHSAQYNLAINQVNNCQIIRMSSEDLTAAFNQQREFQRLKERQIVLADYQFSTVLVDPPRAGLDDQTLQLISRFDNILYISCNPDTLVANLTTLCQSHTIEKAALFDQFPYTHHIETGVLLRRR